MSKQRVAIIGVGSVKAGRYRERTETDLAIEAVTLALADAGLVLPGQDRLSLSFSLKAAQVESYVL